MADLLHDSELAEEKRSQLGPSVFNSKYIAYPVL